MSFAERVQALLDAQGATAVERALIESEIREMTRLEGLGANDTWRLEMGPQGEGAYFKPVNGVSQAVAYQFGHTRESVFLSEVTAYRLAFALGDTFAALVPACVIRTVEEIDPDAPGSLAEERFANRTAEVFLRAPALALRSAFFDALIANQDRTIANILFDAERGDVALIDHGFAFPREGDVCNASVLLAWRRDAGVLDLNPEESSALERMLADDELLGLTRYLEADRLEPVALRAERMLERGTLE